MLTEIGYEDLALILFAGIGPIKVAAGYLGVTSGLPLASRYRIALLTVLIGAALSFVLLFTGNLLEELLHVSVPSLLVAAGAILFVFSVRLALAGGEDAEGPTEVEPVRVAASPLAVPFMVNPLGIAALVVLTHGLDDVVALGTVALIIAAIMLLNLIVLVGIARFGVGVSPTAALLIERVLAILVAAVAVQVFFDGLFEILRAEGILS